MPELPEVETIKRQLNEVLVGKMIASVEMRGKKSFDGDVDMVIGMTVVGIRRFGKGLVVDLKRVVQVSDTEPARERMTGGADRLSLVIHLKMTGQLIFESHFFDPEGIRAHVGDPSGMLPSGRRGGNGESFEEHLQHRIVGGHPTSDFVNVLPSSHTRVIFYFKAGEVLYFNDQRMFGWVKLMETKEVENLSFIRGLGPEPWVMTEEQWLGIFNTKKPVKVRLMDQDKVAGIGNIYANDALWEAGIDPRRSASSLSEGEKLRLLETVKKVLDDGIFYGGATAGDGKFVDLEGLGGKYQEHFRVYQREGQTCLRNDGGVICKAMIGGRGTFWCERCQK